MAFRTRRRTRKSRRRKNPVRFNRARRSKRKSRSRRRRRNPVRMNRARRGRKRFRSRRRRNPVRMNRSRRGRKRFRSRKRRRNPMRSNYRINRSRRGRGRRRRRNPMRAFRTLRSQLTLGTASLNIGRLIGAGAGAGLKALVINTLPIPFIGRGYGLISILVGAMLAARQPRRIRGNTKELFKGAGQGMILFGFYDLLVSNVPFLGAYLPTIGAPSFLSPGPAMGNLAYGRSMYGSSINQTAPEIVGATNISANISPEIVGEDMDLADALEMSM